MGADFDVFLSHAWADGDRPRQLADALTAAGLRVWFDAVEIEDFASITHAVTAGLARSKALLAYYSATYPQRRACQWELTAAFLAAQRDGDPRARVLVVSPEDGAAHIHPIELRDAKFRLAPKSDADLQQLVAAIAAHLARVDGCLPDIKPLDPPPWHGTKPVRYERFVGRFQEMWQLHSALQQSANAQVTGASGQDIALLTGLGGSGKSLLAKEYALRFGAAYPGGVFWLNAYGNDDAKAALSEEGRTVERGNQQRTFAQDLGIDVQGKQADEILADLRRELERRGQQCLWVVDDLQSGLNEDAFRRWCAPHPLARTLITTRSRAYRNLGSGAAVGLDVLRAEDAYQLLTSRRAPAGTDEEAEARELAGDLGYHALALDVTASAIVEYGERDPYRTFRHELSGQHDDALELATDLVDPLPTGHEPSIVRTLLRSIRSLGPEAKDFLRLASVLAVAPIPASLVADTFQRVDGIDRGAAQQQQRKAFHEVTRASLAEVSGEKQDARAVHTLVSRVVRFHEAGSAERTQVQQDAVVMALGTEITKTSGDPALDRHTEVYVTHARLIVRTLENVAEAELCNLVGDYDLGRGYYSSAGTLFERALDFRTRTLGDEHPDTLRSRYSLAAALRWLGDLPRANQLADDTLMSRVRVLGMEHPSTLSSMNLLAEILREQGNLEWARELQQEALNIRRRVLGPEHPATLNSMGNLALILRAQGDVAAARSAQEEVLALQRRVAGPEHTDTLTAMSNLATTLWMVGDEAGARQLEEEVLSARGRVLKPEHPERLNAMNSLAATLHAQGDYAGARALQTEVLDIVRRTLGPRHPNTMTSAWNLFMTLYRMGAGDEARDLLQHDLVWLLDSDPAGMSADLRQIRDYVPQAIKALLPAQESQ